ncbi:hypothetical protein PYCC9005_004624 [Savitreella phatthalungensis]
MMSAADDISELQLQLEQVQGALLHDPENSDLLTLVQELHDLIDLTRRKAERDEATRSSKTDKASARSVTSDDSLSASFSRNVGDTVRAKWVTGDHQFYLARILSVTGSSEDPVYTVKFVDYPDRCSVLGHQLRPPYEPKRGGRQSTQADKQSTPAGGFGVMNRRSTSAADDGAQGTPQDTQPPKKKENALDNKKASWQAFASSGGVRSGGLSIGLKPAKPAVPATIASKTATQPPPPPPPPLRSTRQPVMASLPRPPVRQRHVFGRDDDYDSRHGHARSRSRSRSRSPGRHSTKRRHERSVDEWRHERDHNERRQERNYDERRHDDRRWR